MEEARDFLRKWSSSADAKAQSSPESGANLIVENLGKGCVLEFLKKVEFLTGLENPTVFARKTYGLFANKKTVKSSFSA
jgi:hypothetical protein